MRVQADYDGLLVGYIQKPITSEIILFDEGFRVPDDGYQYGQLLHDVDVLGMPRQHQPGYSNKKDAMPATRKLRPYNYNGQVIEYEDLPPAWHWWIYNFFDHVTGGKLPRGRIEYFYILNSKKEQVIIPQSEASRYATVYCEYTPGSLLWAYGNYIQKSRAFTDGQPPEIGRYDAVTNRNPGARPYQWNCAVVTTGNIMRILGSWDKYYRAQTYKLNDPPPAFDQALGEPWRLHAATEQTTVKLPNGRYVVSRFPQLRKPLGLWGHPQIGTPHPVITMTGETFVEKKWIRMLQPGERYSMYEPEK